MQVMADRNRCMGLGNCELAAPGVFQVGDDGVVRVRAGDVHPDSRDGVAAAVDGCPNQALSLIGE